MVQNSRQKTGLTLVELAKLPEEELERYLAELPPNEKDRIIREIIRQENTEDLKSKTDRPNDEEEPNKQPELEECEGDDRNKSVTLDEGNKSGEIAQQETSTNDEKSFWDIENILTKFAPEHNTKGHVHSETHPNGPNEQVQTEDTLSFSTYSWHTVTLNRVNNTNYSVGAKNENGEECIADKNDIKVILMTMKNDGHSSFELGTIKSPEFLARAETAAAELGMTISNLEAKKEEFFRNNPENRQLYDKENEDETIASCLGDKENIAEVRDIKALLRKLKEQEGEIEIGDIKNPETLAKIEVAAKEIGIPVKDIEDKKRELEEQGKLEQYESAAKELGVHISSTGAQDVSIGDEQTEPNNENTINPNTNDNGATDRKESTKDRSLVEDTFKDVSIKDTANGHRQATKKLDALVKIGNMSPEEYNKYKETNEYNELKLNKKEVKLFDNLNKLKNNEEFSKEDDKKQARIIGIMVSKYHSYVNSDTKKRSKRKREFVRDNIARYNLIQQRKGTR